MIKKNMKKKVTLLMDEKTVHEAKKEGINMSQFCEIQLRRAIDVLHDPEKSSSKLREEKISLRNICFPCLFTKHLIVWFKENPITGEKICRACGQSFREKDIDEMLGKISEKLVPIFWMHNFMCE